jgi:5-methylcytosine-specific restriction endonuclease McrA
VIDERTRHLVRQRADDRCEYCRLRQAHDAFHSFQIEHIIARQHRGGDDPGNLALACHTCNSHKGTNLFGRDPDTDESVRLFHPRDDVWTAHFRFNGPLVAGISAIGRTTAWLLRMNSPQRLELRRVLIELGELD